MTRRRRQFSPEFKEEAVRMVLEGERTVASVAREFRSTPAPLAVGYTGIGSCRTRQGSRSQGRNGPGSGSWSGRMPSCGRSWRS
ncbi:transposase [Nonomuraea sp. NPDC050783]|uniref:transposase n=1 Tax=Nonomuraea sp. NPDC050783 TaxID=3154634 RepID=UPI003465C6F7